jgi:hypothetical protein
MHNADIESVIGKSLKPSQTASHQANHEVQ